MIPKKYIRKRETIERLEVIGQMSEYDSVILELQNEGFRVTSGGPYTDKKMWPNVDPWRFKYVVERVVES